MRADPRSRYLQMPSMEPVGCGNPFMQLAGTSGGARRAGHVVVPGLATLVDEVQTNGWTWRLQPERPMRSVRVVVLDVDPEHLFQVASPNDQQPVQALGPDRADPAFRMGVGPRRQLHPMPQMSSELSG